MKKKFLAMMLILAVLIGVTVVPAMASVNVLTNTTTTGSNVVQIHHRMYGPYLPNDGWGTALPWRDSYYPVPIVVTTPTTQTIPTTTTVTTPTTTTSTGSNVVSLKGIVNNSSTSVSGTVVQSNPTVTTTPATATPIVPATLVLATSITDDEQQMIDLINQDRARNGLPALKVDLRLVSAAREKSEDIKANKYFTHTSPNFGYTASLFPQMDLNVIYWAENVGAQMTVEAAESALEMDIPHQQNILDPNVNYVGVGIAYGSIYGNVYTQEFVKE